MFFNQTKRRFEENENFFTLMELTAQSFGALSLVDQWAFHPC